MGKATRKNEDSSNDFRGAIRALPAKLVKVTDEQHERWLRTSITLQRLQNRIIGEWKRYHNAKGNDAAVARWMDDLKAWHRAEAKKRGAKPKCPTLCWPKDFDKTLAPRLRKEFPGINSRCVTLALKKMRETMATRKATNSAFKQWQLAVADLGELTVFKNPQPLPVDKQNSTLLDPEDDVWRFQLRVDRFDTGTKRAKSTLDTVTLSTFGDKQKRTVERVLTGCQGGELKFCGSSIQFGFRGKSGWYLMLAYRERKIRPADVDKRRKLVLRPAVDHPWEVEIDGKTFWVGGPGRLVGWHRRRLLMSRTTRRDLGKVGKKKGRGHDKRIHVFNNQLARYKKTYTEQVAAKVIQIATDRRIGTIQLEVPTEAEAKWTFLAVAGAPTKRPDSWPWHTMETKLRHHAERLGLKILPKKVGVAWGKAEKEKREIEKQKKRKGKE